MHKIANTRELTSELERLLEYARSHQPSRSVLASELRELGSRIMLGKVKSESDIIHESGNHWVTEEPFKGRKVCKVWRGSSSRTHGKLVATFDLGDRSRARAIADCDRREHENK